MREVGKGSLRTRLGREKVLVFYQVLYPCHNIINVRRRRQVYALALLVDPWIAQTKMCFELVDFGWMIAVRTLHQQTSLDMLWKCSTPQWCHKTHSGCCKSQTLSKCTIRFGTGGTSSPALLIATHSMMSTYLGSITMVLRFPLTSAASIKGLHRYSGFCAGGGGANIELGATASMLFEDVEDFFCTRCVLQETDRLQHR